MVADLKNGNFLLIPRKVIFVRNTYTLFVSGQYSKQFLPFAEHSLYTKPYSRPYSYVISFGSPVRQCYYTHVRDKELPHM